MDIHTILDRATKNIKYTLPILIGNEITKLSGNNTLFTNDSIDNFCLIAKTSEIFELNEIFNLSPDIQKLISEEMKMKIKTECKKRIIKMEQE